MYISILSYLFMDDLIKSESDIYMELYVWCCVVLTGFKISLIYMEKILFTGRIYIYDLYEQQLVFNSWKLMYFFHFCDPIHRLSANAQLLRHFISCMQMASYYIPFSGGLGLAQVWRMVYVCNQTYKAAFTKSSDSHRHQVTTSVEPIHAQNGKIGPLMWVIIQKMKTTF